MTKKTAQITAQYGNDLFEFANGLFVYSGDPESTDEMQRDPFPYFDEGECLDYMTDMPAKQDKIDYDKGRDALKWLVENYENNDEWDKECDLRIGRAYRAILKEVPDDLDPLPDVLIEAVELIEILVSNAPHYREIAEPHVDALRSWANKISHE